ncbi:MAG: YbhB/YbcL family Raf kinase inhibitor-like protein [Actinobacteria bacterium]|nr:YbhB/YbcL family Raf kinase inhibitor-like protein [Actinomycetota bacterium]MBU1493219.1 YbhB/YbcL family Raf kinase inhibitor-like protein [Actinomycetota bacterium]MBU1865491.1 YbhB/YbcL family Raf kinase inhibitor-like protein [Actinomycetota bacterium]
MRLTSPAFAYGRRIPPRFTGDGEENSPPLTIDDLPAGTISLALVMEDPDAPGGTWAHWVLFDLPPVGAIAEGARSLGTPGVNSWRRIGYGGPCPPSGIHRYLFRVFALDDTLRLPERSTRAEVLAAMEGHVLGEAVLMGRYGR